MREPTREERERVYKADLKRLNLEINAFRKTRLQEIDQEINQRFHPRLAALRLLLNEDKGEPQASLLPVRIPKSASEILDILRESPDVFSNKDIKTLLSTASKPYTDKSVEHGLYWLKKNKYVEWNTPPRGPAPGSYRKGPALTKSFPPTVVGTVPRRARLLEF